MREAAGFSLPGDH